MARKNIKAVIPINSPDAMISLSEAITEKHESYGGGAVSPLHAHDMGGFKTKTENGKLMLASARSKDATAQVHTETAWTIMGISEGQTIETDGTLYFMIDAIRLILLGVNVGSEQALEEYGFTVVKSETKGRRNTKIEIPIGSPDKLLELCSAIVLKHESLAVSPLADLDMVTFKNKTLDAIAELKLARSLHDTAQKESEQAYRIIGMSEGQNLQSEGTLYNMINGMKKTLLGTYKGVEESLEEWGFTVVITETMPHRNSKRITVIIPKNQFVTVSNIVNHSEGKNIGVTDLEWCASHTVCTPENASVLNPDEVAEINTPDGVVTIKNRSTVFSGRIRLSVTN